MMRFVVTTQGALTAATTQTFLQVKPASGQGCLIKKWEVYFDGSQLAAGIRVQLVMNSSDGTSAGSPPTPRLKNPNFSPTSNMTIGHKFSAEPTLDYILLDKYIDQVAGFCEQFPLDEEYGIKGGGDRIAVRIITPAGVSPNCTVGFEYDE